MFPSGEEGYHLNISYANIKELTQQYFTDMWAKIESQRLLYIRLNQKQLRSDLYKGTNFLNF